MRKLAIPFLAYIAVAISTFLLIDSAVRVYAQFFVCLAIALLVPSLWAARTSSSVRRFAVGALCALAGILFFDSTAPLVIVKADIFGVFHNGIWFYAAGVVVFTLASFCIAWLAAPLRLDLFERS